MFETYADIFEQRAGAYHSAMRQWPRARDAEFRSVLELLADEPDGLVCDMPSGGGYLAVHLRPGLRYVGVDPAEGFVAACAEDAPLNTIHSPITDVPLPDNSVDYVVSLAGLHHEPSLVYVFAEMRRLVRPGGRVVIADAAEETSTARFLNGFVARNNPQGHDGRFLDTATQPLLERAGLQVVDDQQVEMPWVFDSIAEAGAFCGALFGLSGATPEAVAGALTDDIGFDEGLDCVRLKWTLRRIICHVP